MNILFRTHASPEIGLGHLVRCRNLAEHFQDNGHSCLFLIDEDHEIIRPFLKGLPYQVAENGPQDTIDYLKQDPFDILIIDDDRIDIEWEKAVRSFIKKMVVLDDILRPHMCDYLIDCRWRGEKTPYAYNGLVPEHTKLLLGPAYALTPKQTLVSEKKGETFHVMIGPGFLKPNACLELLAQLDDGIVFDYVIGPFDTITQKDLDLCKQNDRINLIRGKTNLFNDLQKVDLYIGAAGGIIYQLRALNVPALTFSKALNQENELNDLEDIGHYFHINSAIDHAPEKIIRFIETLRNNTKRVRELGRNSKVKIDTLGAERIYKSLIEEEFDKQTPAPRSKTENTIRLSDTQLLIPVDDGHINRYLTARNRPENQLRMIERQSIHPLDHYGWWFKTQRESWLLLDNGEPQLYIWHEVKQYQEKQYLIGGWFVVDQETNFQNALIALNWQLNHCDKAYPNLSWLAVIHKENKFVKLLNEYVGFIDVSEKHPEYNALLTLFPNADPDEFTPVMRIAPKKEALAQ